MSRSIRSAALLTGTWEIHWMPGADETTPVGPQVGSGALDGPGDASGFDLSLHPVSLLASPSPGDSTAAT